jgi:chromate transporter
LKSALAAVTAAVVGVILNLTVWFALHVLFAKVGEVRAGPLTLMVPDPATLEPLAVALAALAFLLLFALHRGIATTLAVCAAASLLWHFV